MIEMRWYGVTINCGECKTDTTLQMMMYSADGELRFTFYCPKCKELLHWNVFASALQQIAMRKDFEKSQPILQPQQPIRPPMAIPPEKLTEKDKKLLKDFGIEEES